MMYFQCYKADFLDNFKIKSLNFGDLFVCKSFFYLVFIAIDPENRKMLFSNGANLGIYDDNFKKIAQDRFLTITITK